MLWIHKRNGPSISICKNHHKKSIIPCCIPTEASFEHPPTTYVLIEKLKKNTNSNLDAFLL